MTNRVACTVPRREISDLLQLADVGSDAWQELIT
jgi:hypothetical protein